MAEFKDVVREYDRMCKKTGCNECPIASSNNGSGLACRLFVRRFPKRTENIIMQWASEHTLMTNRRKFEEVFGFDILERFLFCEHDKEWFNKEYKGGDNHDG